jgi:hypothetical protein
MQIIHFAQKVLCRLPRMTDGEKARKIKKMP